MFTTITETENWIIKYDKEKGMYEVSYFKDGHFVDNIYFDQWFDEEKRPIITLTFDFEKIDIMTAEGIIKNFYNQYPQYNIIGLPTGVSLSEYSKEELIRLRETIDKLIEKC